MKTSKIFSLRTLMANAVAIALALTITGATFAHNVSAHGTIAVANQAQKLVSQTSQSLPDLKVFVGGDKDGCVGAVIGFSLALLAGGIAIAATAGAGAPAVALVLAGSYAPLAAAAC